jgi:entericidin B
LPLKSLIRLAETPGTPRANAGSCTRSRVNYKQVLYFPVKEFNMKRLIALALALSYVFVAGCNTVEGAGKDVKATGGAIEKAADQSKPK